MNPPLAISLKIASTLAFTLMLTCIKAVGDAIPTGEVVFARSAFALVPIVAMLAWQGTLRTALKTRHPWGHVGRGLVGVAAMGLWFAAVPHLPLPEAMAISYATPLLIVALAAIVLRESVRATRWTAVAAGFTGIMVILWPRLSGSSADAEAAIAGAAALAIASTFGMAVSAMFVRRMTATETTGSIVFYFSLMASLVGLLSAPFGWAAPSPQEAVLLICAGLLGGVGQILLTLAYRHAETSIVAPFDYASMLWGIVIGLVLFEEAPRPNVLLGGAVVIAAGLVIIFRENRLGLPRARLRNVATPQG